MYWLMVFWSELLWREDLLYHHSVYWKECPAQIQQQAWQVRGAPSSGFTGSPGADNLLCEAYLCARKRQLINIPKRSEPQRRPWRPRKKAKSSSGSVFPRGRSSTHFINSNLDIQKSCGRNCQLEEDSDDERYLKHIIISLVIRVFLQLPITATNFGQKLLEPLHLAPFHAPPQRV